MSYGQVWVNPNRPLEILLSRVELAEVGVDCPQFGDGISIPREKLHTFFEFAFGLGKAVLGDDDP